MFKCGIFTFSPGDRITCIIRGEHIMDAKIFFRETSSNCRESMAWICHNNPNFSGSQAQERYGYKYSWAFTMSSAGSTTDDITNLSLLVGNIGIKSGLFINAEVMHFIRLNSLESILPLFQYKLGIFDEFETYEVGESDGSIKLKNEKKSVEIKLSRFIRQLSNKLSEFAKENKCLHNISISDKEIEAIYNKFVSYQKDSTQVVTFLSGKELLKGYDRTNYKDDEGGTLHKSCMVNKPDFLSLYTDNPNQIELALIYSEDKIVARCLVWTATDGKKYSDRIYYRYDWLENLLKDKLRKLDINPIDEQCSKSVQLDNWKMERFPYADSFYHFDRELGTLLYFNSSRYTHLRNTDGTIQ